MNAPRRTALARASAFALLWLAAGALRADPPSFDLADEKTAAPADRTLVVTSPKDLAAAGITGHGSRDVVAVVTEALKDQPAGTKVRVIIGEQTEGSVRWRLVYPKSAVALDAEGRPHGSEYLAVIVDAGTGRINAFRRVPWEHGVRHGLEKEYDGERVSAEVPWVNGKMAGVRKSFFPNGQVQSESPYVAGQANGVTRTWDADGALTSEATMKNGEREGQMTEYWPGTTQARRLLEFHHGVAHGAVREFYPTGKLKRKCSLADGSLHGADESYNEQGEVTHTRYWWKGDPVSAEEFARRTAPPPASGGAGQP